MPYSPQNTPAPNQQPPRQGRSVSPHQSGQIPPVQNAQNPSQSGRMQAVPAPSQSGRIPQVTQPYNSGQIPQVTQPYNSGQFAAVQPTAQLPMMPAQPTGQVTGSQSPTMRKGKSSGSGLLKVGIIAAIVAVIVLIVTLVLVIFKPFGLFEEKLSVERPTSSQVEDAFDDANLPAPDLSTFAYVDDDDLEMTNIGDYSAGEVQYSKSGNSTEAYCEATAEAEYENDSVSVKQTLTMRMDYDKQAQEWKAGSVREGTLSAKPEGPADIDAITENFLNILKTYDAKIAEMYVGADVKETSTLTNKGGTATFTVTKTDGDTTRTCTANTDITWSDTNGWNVQVTSVSGDVELPEDEAAEESTEQPEQTVTPEPVSPSDGNSSNSSGNSGSGNSGGTGDGATMGLVCFTGELVEVPGTIQFNNSGAILLRTDARYRVVLDGKTYVVDYFEIGASAGNYHNGQHVTLIGEISYRGTVSNAPLFTPCHFERAETGLH